MDVSLDDFIKQNRGTRRGSGGGGSRRGGGGAIGKFSSGMGSRRGSTRRPTGVYRGRGRGGISRSSSSYSSRGRSTSSYGNGYTSSSKREAFFGSSSSPPRRYGSSSSDTTKLIVSNLDFGVTDSDILELFNEFGQLKSAGIHYDRSGRSLGSADLIFMRRADAIKAMKQYNGVPLDGREMNIQLATSEVPSGSSIRGSRLGGGGFKPRGSFRGRGGRGSFSGGRGGRGRGGDRPSGGRGGGGARGQTRKQPTAEELDAELEEYVKSKAANSEGA
ncbi:hypothetical protein QAD02_006553 [Eretmocerus hayati]|uniref:Uncharacterized protein n=1 Tax=Eretmocerus hayati TaxID=131215 RepID=A0ACC2N213_9HYME|nr:hypothetical protein QAD02_006553 [Eretmocerus hayati]